MTNSHRVHAVASACLVISLASCVLLLRHLDKVRPKATIEDTLYISSPKVVHDASLGFDGLMACLYWTRTVQYFGHRHFDGAESYNELAPLLEITTALDPHMTPAYQFGASFLAPRPSMRRRSSALTGSRRFTGHRALPSRTLIRHKHSLRALRLPCPGERQM